MLAKIKSLFEKYNSGMKAIQEFLKTPNAGYLTSEGLQKKINEDKTKIREELKPGAENLLMGTRNNIIAEEKNLFKNKFPSLTSTDPTSKLNGELQIQAAKNALSTSTENIFSELEFAKSSNRLDFFHYILDNAEKNRNAEDDYKINEYKTKYYNESKLLEPLENAKYENKLMNYFTSMANMEELPERIFFPFSMSEIKRMPQNVVRENLEAVNQSMIFHDSK